MANFLLYPPDGGPPQGRTATSRKELDERDNPDGWEVVEVNRLSHDPCERFDRTTRRWKKCPVKTAEHAEREAHHAEKLVGTMSDHQLDLIADRVVQKLEARGLVVKGDL